MSIRPAIQCSTVCILDVSCPHLHWNVHFWKYHTRKIFFIVIESIVITNNEECKKNTGYV